MSYLGQHELCVWCVSCVCRCSIWTADPVADFSNAARRKKHSKECRIISLFLSFSLYPHILNTRNTFKWTQPLYSHFLFIFCHLFFICGISFCAIHEKHIHTHEHIQSFRLSALNVRECGCERKFFFRFAFLVGHRKCFVHFQVKTHYSHTEYVLGSKSKMPWNCVNLLPVTNSIPRSHSRVCDNSRGISLNICEFRANQILDPIFDLLRLHERT